MNFAVYTKDGCPYCTTVKQVLDGKGYNFQEYKLDEHFNREAFFQEFGEGSTFPQVKLGAENLGGCTETVKYLRENNLV